MTFATQLTRRLSGTPLCMFIRTQLAYPQFKRLTSARVRRVFFTPSLEEVDRAESAPAARSRASRWCWC
ncbi:hypothetical protein ACFQYP_32990 [Nonomuraea antimicrobica]